MYSDKEYHFRENTGCMYWRFSENGFGYGDIDGNGFGVGFGGVTAGDGELYTGVNDLYGDGWCGKEGNFAFANFQAAGLR